MNDCIVVGLSDYKISKASQVIATYALGSCVGTAIYDKGSGIGGLSHIMLPDSKMVKERGSVNRKKYANTAIPDMVDELVQYGASRRNLRAKIAGGANMFGAQSLGTFGNIGERNVESVKKELQKLGIPLIGEDTGANYGRTVFLDLESGVYRIKSIGKKINEL